MTYNPYTFNTGDVINAERINSLAADDLTDANIASTGSIAWTKVNKTGSSVTNFSNFPTQSGNADKYLSSDGANYIWQAISGGSGKGMFFKEDPNIVAFTKTGNGTAEIKAGTLIDVSGTTVAFMSATSISMPTFAAGTDYAIWVSASGTIQATDNFTSPPAAGSWRKIGGFHYAPGGNATAQSGGNTTAQINEYSFWDLKFRPVCADPRGMTLVADTFWADIYLCGVDAIVNGSSK